MSYGVDYRRGSDPALLWLWCRLADAAPIQPLAWKLPYAMDMGLKGKKKKSPFYFTLIFNFFWLSPQHAEVPRPGIKPMQQQ